MSKGCLNTLFKSKGALFCQLQLNTTMVIVKIKMVCGIMTVDNDEAGLNMDFFILTAVVAFGNEKFTNTENIELLTHSSLKIMKEGPHH